MPDWNEIVKTRLGPLGVDPEREAEIVAELAAHFEQLYEDMQTQGMAHEEALQRALSSVADCPKVRHEIRVAERGDGLMNLRVKCVWLPGLCAAAIYFAWLQLMRSVAPSVRNFAGNVSLGFILFAIMIFVSVGIGAGVAFLSKRMGGGHRHQVLGALVPAVVILAYMLTEFGGYYLARMAMFPRLKPGLLFLWGQVMLAGFYALLFQSGVLLVRLRSKRPDQAGPGSQSPSAAGEHKHLDDGVPRRWLHRFKFVHA